MSVFKTVQSSAAPVFIPEKMLLSYMYLVRSDTSSVLGVLTWPQAALPNIGDTMSFNLHLPVNMPSMWWEHSVNEDLRMLLTSL
jgi:hypothetical protein